MEPSNACKHCPQSAGTFFCLLILPFPVFGLDSTFIAARNQSLAHSSCTFNKVVNKMKNSMDSISWPLKRFIQALMLAPILLEVATPGDTPAKKRSRSRRSRHSRHRESASPRRSRDSPSRRRRYSRSRSRASPRHSPGIRRALPVADNATWQETTWKDPSWQTQTWNPQAPAQQGWNQCSKQEPAPATNWSTSDWQEASWEQPAPWEGSAKDSRCTFPSSFKQDAQHLDAGSEKQLPLFRRVQPTDHAVSKGIANTNILELPLWKCLYKGIENWCLRYVAAGKPTFFILTKSYAVSTFLYMLTKVLKETDIEACAATWNKTLATPEPTATDTQRTELIKKFAEYIGDTITKSVSNDDKLYQRINSLEKQLVDKASKNALISGAGPHLLGKFGFVTSENSHKHLAIDCPASRQPKEVQAFAIKHLKKAALPKVSSTSDEIKLIVKAIGDKDTELDTIRFSLAEWGMPMALAGNFDYEQGIKVIAIVHLM